MAMRTWEDRELPLLEAVLEAEDNGDRIRDIDAIADMVDHPADETNRIVRSLHEDGFLQGIESSSLSGYDLMEIRPTAKTRRACQQWPSENGYEDLLAIIDRTIDYTDDPDERGRLRKLRDSFKELSRPVAASIVTALIRDRLGI